MSKSSLVQSIKPTAKTNIGQLRHLPHDVLVLIVGEAEERLRAQLQSRLASDQRGYTIAALLATLATAVTGGFIGFIQSNIPLNTYSVLILGIGLWLGASFAVLSVWPSKFCFPGNEPKNWLPNTWPENQKRDIKLARLEQCRILQWQIEQNQTSAFKRAMWQISSLMTAFLTFATFAIISA